MKKWLKIGIFLIVVVLLVVGAVRLVKKKRAQMAQIPIAKEYAVLAKTIKPSKTSLTLTTPYISLVQSDSTTLLAAKFAGRVLMVQKAGKRVKKGDVVAKIDDTTLQTKLASLEASLQATKEALDATKAILHNLYDIHARTKKLLKVKGASIEQYEKEQNQIESTKAKLASLSAKLQTLMQNKKELKNELTYASLRSPVDGIVAKRFLNVGDLAMPGRPLLKINAARDNYLLVRVPKDVKVYAVVYKSKEYPVTPLHSTFNALNEYRCNVEDDKLIEGERVNVDVVTFKGVGTLVPYDAILNRNGKNYVLIAQGFKAQPKEVHIKASGQKGVVVQEDLSGQKIVLAKPDILLKLLSGIKLKEIKD